MSREILCCCDSLATSFFQYLVASRTKLPDYFASCDVHRIYFIFASGLKEIDEETYIRLSVMGE